MTINVNTQINNAAFENIKKYLNENFSYVKEKRINISMDVNIDKNAIEIINRYLLEQFKTKKDKVSLFFEKHTLLKDFFSSSVLISLMQIMMFIVFASFGVIPPMYMDYVGLKMLFWGAISLGGYFYRKYLFTDKEEIKRGFLLSLFFSSIYQLDGFLIY